ncbi:EthD family reductase [Pseudomonas sp. AD21]|uniref:EthD family reductase n=1 Tax=Pseudomonas sp. AD21 TaxID=396378 RepID=UPI000C831ACD|nr:EthD family reductase [Pseudomonas sp. AD21]
MIDVSILYPNEADCSFDFDYYITHHMPMIQQKMGGACSHFTIEKGLQGPTPGSRPTYIAMGHLFFESLESFVDAFVPHAKAIAADIDNYTNVKPVVQISEILIA